MKRPLQNHSKNALKFFFAASLFFFFSCSERSARVEAGLEDMDSGDYDAAMLEFQIACMQSPGSPDCQAGMGFLLSLKKITVYSAVDLLEQSIARRPDEKVRRELAMLYLDLGMNDRAKTLTGAENMSVEQFFSRPMVDLRSGINCLVAPQQRYLDTLLKQPQTAQRDYYLSRCYALLGTGFVDKAKLYFKSVNAGDLRCELIALHPDLLKTELPDVALALTKCRSDFPGDLVLNRERPMKAEQTPALRKIFTEGDIVPADPKPRPKDEDTGGGPYVISPGDKPPGTPAAPQ